ncbi:ankyrin repeat domain-containing protein EMB506, chloroplastic [Impatiens glandulifera]|uniref:ankyrin repeat domain-containing protein EMB506, chloroplastic n=1 Tax=Impatiens glandulifera TaxID=253017 RepID=UPI001FB16FD4|nr:ankyrin repeat domain-containing protein EMB506, chloroplastic [Impatiens glandulifera]
MELGQRAFIHQRQLNQLLFSPSVAASSYVASSHLQRPRNQLRSAFCARIHRSNQTFPLSVSAPFVKKQQSPVSLVSRSSTYPPLCSSRKPRFIIVTCHSQLSPSPEFWEDPDDGSESDHDDDMNDDEENELDFEAKSSAYLKNSTAEEYDENLRKEVELLLGPDEREILQKNEKFNLDKLSTAKWNPLHSLALAGQIQHMDMLLDSGIHIDDVDKDGRTALHTAIIGKKEAVISHLLRKGANPHVKDADGASPIHYAVGVGAIQTVKLLIKYNVDLNGADNEGWTPLHVAIQGRNRDIAKILIVNGADKNRRNKVGKTALDLALCYGKDFKSFDLVKLLKLVPARYL